MKSNKKNSLWMILGVVVAIALLLYWLFAGTTLEQEANPEVNPMEIEQNV